MMLPKEGNEICQCTAVNSVSLKLHVPGERLRSHDQDHFRCVTFFKRLGHQLFQNSVLGLLVKRLELLVWVEIRLQHCGFQFPRRRLGIIIVHYH